MEMVDGLQHEEPEATFDPDSIPLTDPEVRYSDHARRDKAHAEKVVRLYAPGYLAHHLSGSSADRSLITIPYSDALLLLLYLSLLAQATSEPSVQIIDH